MNFFEFIIIATIVIILLGCIFFANSSTIYNYFTETTLASYDRYDIHVIDDNDLDNIGRALQSQLAGGLPNNEPYESTNNLTNNLTDNPTNNPINNPINKSTNDSSNEMKGINVVNEIINRHKSPNAPIPDTKLITHTENNRNFGNELPWDREVGFCEVLRGSDRDLYRNVQDSTTITLY